MIHWTVYEPGACQAMAAPHTLAQAAPPSHEQPTTLQQPTYIIIALVALLGSPSVNFRAPTPLSGYYEQWPRRAWELSPPSSSLSSAPTSAGTAQRRLGQQTQTMAGVGDGRPRLTC